MAFKQQFGCLTQHSTTWHSLTVLTTVPARSKGSTDMRKPTHEPRGGHEGVLGRVGEGTALKQLTGLAK